MSSYRLGSMQRGHWNGGDIFWHDANFRCETCVFEDDMKDSPAFRVTCTEIDNERGTVTYSSDKNGNEDKGKIL